MLNKAVVVLACVLFSAVEANASLIPIQRLTSDDNIVDIEITIQSFRDVHVDIYLYDKLENAGSTLKTVSTNYAWDVIDPLVMISFVTVKAGNDYMLYELGPSGNSGPILNASWNYTLLTTQEFDPRTSPVPESGTFVMAIGGFAAMYLARRQVRFHCSPKRQTGAIKS